MKIKLNKREALILKNIIQSYNEIEGEYLNPDNKLSIEIKTFIDRMQLEDLVSVSDDFGYNV